MGRWIGRAVLGLIAAALNLAIILILAWFLVVPRFAAEVMVAEAQRAGVPVESLRVNRLWLGGADVSDIQFAGGGPFIRRARVTFRRQALADQGELETVEIVGARLTIAIDEAGSISVEGLDSLINSDTGSNTAFSLPQLPIREIVLEDTEISLSTPLGPVALPLDATMRPIAEGGLIVSAELDPEWRDQRAGIVLQARVDSDGAFDALVTIVTERMAWQQLQLTGADGWLAASGSPSGLSAIEGQVETASIVYGDWRLGPTRIFALGEDLPNFVTIRTETEDGSASLALDAQVMGLAEGTPEIALDMTLAADRLSPLAQFLPLPLDTEGRALVDVSLVAPLDALADPLGFPFSGDVSVLLEEVVVPGQVEDLTVAVAADLIWNGSDLVFSSDRRWRVTGWLDDLEDRFRLDLAPLGDRLAIELDAGRTGVAVQSLVQVAVGSYGTVSAEMDVAYEGGRFDQSSVVVDHFNATISAQNVNGLTVTPLEISLVGGGEAGRFVGDLDAIVAANGQSPIFDIANGAARFDGRLEIDQTEIRYFADDCQYIAYDRLAIERTEMVPLNGAICIAGVSDLPLFSVPTSLVGVQSIDALITGLAARIDPETSPLDTTIGALALSGTAIDGFALELGLADSSLDIPNDGILIDGIAGDVIMQEALDGTLDVAGPVTAEAILISGRPRPMVPLSVDATLSGTLSQPFIEGVGIADNLGLRFPARFSYDGPTGVGRVEVDIPGLQFAEGRLQPSMLFPILNEFPTDSIDGLISGDVLILFGAESVNSAVIRVNNATIRRPEITLGGVSGTVRLSNFAPPRASNGQRLSIAEAEFGPLFRNGTVSFGLGRGNTLSVGELQFDWAGGQVSAQPFSFDLDNINTEVTLEASGVSLEEVLLEFPVEDLSATGILDGTLPVRLLGETIFVDGGRLQSRGPGIIRYTPQQSADAGEQGLQILFDAVRNFHYDSVGVSISGDTSDDLVVGLEIAGNNPDLYGGYPIDLNVNVSGDLADILRQSVRVLSIGDETREFFEGEAGRDTIERLLGQ
ncbi:MAG: YdbH domain-containing protein [Pseudomonadota bacterium]